MTDLDQITDRNARIGALARAFQCPQDAFAGKTLLVTGAGDGIGRALALGLAAHGASVILLGRTQKKLEAVYDAIKAAGGAEPAMVPLNLELASPNQYNELAAMLQQEFGQLDGLVHNAAQLGDITPLEQYDPNTWQQVLQVNLNAGYYLTRALLPLLKAAPNASLLFTTSSVGRKGRAFWGAYAVSKFAVEGMVQVLADELENLTRIRINAINPGACHTDMREKAYPGEDRSLLTQPEAILPAYYYLLSDASVSDDKQVNGLSLDAQLPKR